MNGFMVELGRALKGVKRGLLICETGGELEKLEG